MKNRLLYKVIDMMQDCVIGGIIILCSVAMVVGFVLFVLFLSMMIKGVLS